MDYHNNSKYWDRQIVANSTDQDQMLQNAASDQGLHCLTHSAIFQIHQQVVKWTISSFRTSMVSRYGPTLRVNVVFQI